MDSLSSPCGSSAPLSNPLTFEEARVLGCLMEKERTTPEYYPLTLNQLVAACNQTTNREPVVSLEERAVSRALDGLRERQLALQVTLAGARVQKYKHTAEGKFPRLEKAASALLCVLLLRGQQTVGELRQRTERLHVFTDLPAVEAALKELLEYPEAPLAVSLPPGGGRKSATYMHLLCGPVDTSAFASMTIHAPAPQPAMTEENAEWRTRMEQELQELRAEVRALRERVDGLEEGMTSPSSSEESTADGSVYIP